MDYKSFLSNKELRLKLLDFLGFVPDKEMCKLQFKMF